MRMYLPCCSLCFCSSVCACVVVLWLSLFMRTGWVLSGLWLLVPGMFASPNFPPVPDCQLSLARRPSSSFLSFFRRSVSLLGTPTLRFVCSYPLSLPCLPDPLRLVYLICPGEVQKSRCSFSKGLEEVRVILAHAKEGRERTSMECVHTCSKPSAAVCCEEIPDTRRSGVREGKNHRKMQSRTGASSSRPPIYLFARINSGATNRCADFHMSARFYSREGNRYQLNTKKYTYE